MQYHPAVLWFSRRKSQIILLEPATTTGDRDGIVGESWGSLVFFFLSRSRLCLRRHVTNETAFNRALHIGRGELGAETTRHDVTGTVRASLANFLGGESPRESIRLASYRSLLIRPVTASRFTDQRDCRSSAVS